MIHKTNHQILISLEKPDEGEKIFSYNSSCNITNEDLVGLIKFLTGLLEKNIKEC